VEVRSRPERQVGRVQLEEFVEDIFEDIFGEEIHAKCVASLTDGVDGVLHAATSGIRAIGQGLAAAQGLVPKHATRAGGPAALEHRTGPGKPLPWLGRLRLGRASGDRGQLRRDGVRRLGSVDGGARHADGPWAQHGTRVEDGATLRVEGPTQRS
jgi:hypothetical protein